MNNTPITSRPESQNISDEESKHQVDLIVHSTTLRGSSTLQQLLNYLVSRSTEGTADSLKEYTIGVEAFGRKADFDPRTDTIVRVQTHRLRQKLKDYYDQEGVHAPIFVEIPKGQYCVVFRRKENLTASDAESHGLASHAGPNEIAPLHDEAQKTNTGSAAKRSIFSQLVTIILIVIFAGGLGYFLGNFRTKFSSGERSVLAVDPADPVKKFWAAFLEGDRTPIIAYPNAVFLLDDSNDLLRFRQGASDSRGARVEEHLAQQFASNPTLVKDAGPLYYEDGYTGTGELQGVAMLTQVFAEMGVRPIIKTSRNVTPEDLQEHCVILLGSPFQNVAVGQLFADGDFSFDNPDSHREQWRATIMNAHPQNGENAAYHTERDPQTQVLKMDYSLVSIQPGVVKSRRIAVLGGLDTKGTEGATKFMTSPDGIAALTASLGNKGPLDSNRASRSGDMPYFQALIRVQLEKGDQVLRTDLTSVHPLMAKPSISNADSGQPAKK